ncbi:MAG: hypothetical protein FJ272_14360, partial [Planctomycetes bacterium]|nr:hypothetical protein [Planctomycetota bacterium]
MSKSPPAATGRRAAYGFLALLALAAFLNTTRAGFVWDDHALATPAVGPTTAQDVAESLTPRYWTVAYKFKGKAYRPIRSIILYLNYLCWGGDAGGYHLVSALIHAANTLLAYGLMTRLAGSRLTGLLAASLFAVHPVTA